MIELVSGQPNIYALFMALSASMVKSEGEMVFITPRSFCSGLYYKKFREWFLQNVQIANIHVFESRKEVFGKDGVLQENIIIKAKKLEEMNKYEKLIISTSKGKDFTRLREIEVRFADVVRYKNGESFIRIPASFLDIDILNIVDTWPSTLRDLGLEISTGPVVPFRAEEYLLDEPTEVPESAPLLWMHNMQDMEVVWPLKKSRKASAIRACEGTMPLLLPVKNYVLVKRFSSKEQKRRLYASVLLQSGFPYEIVGIENHVNYIHRPNGNLSVYEAFGIAAILNTALVDNFFRSLNGNTQVNATDIRSLPFPSIEDIRKIGKLVHESQSYRSGFDLENIIAETLGISAEIIENLSKGDRK
jgi:adenine-specific DNA-methyltransferase